MKLAQPSAVKFNEPAPAVGFPDLLGLQCPVEFVEAPPSKRLKLVDDSDSTITVNYGADMPWIGEKAEEGGDEGLGSKMEEGDEGSESDDDDDGWSFSKPVDRVVDLLPRERYVVKEEDRRPGGGIKVCIYCLKRGSQLDHSPPECPLRLKAWTKYCSKCHDGPLNFGPCKVGVEHEDHHYDSLVCCQQCGCTGDPPHNTEDCPRLKAQGIDWYELRGTV